MFLPISGAVVAHDDLRLSTAQAIVRVATRGLPFIDLVACYQKVNGLEVVETVVLDLDVEVPQHPVYDIRPCERIAIMVSTAGTQTADALALRANFPLTPHLNLRHEEHPRSLCLSEEPRVEQALHWTALAFVEKIREWLALTARGELHGDDQPLEPLLAGAAYTLVVPSTFTVDPGEVSTRPLFIVGALGGNGRVLIAEDTTSKEARASSEQRFVAAVFWGTPQTHGIIRRSPRTLADMLALLVNAGIDILSVLRTRLQAWHGDTGNSLDLDARLIMITVLPKTREGGGAVEGADLHAFLCDGTVRDVGAAVGLWAQHNGHVGALLNTEDTAIDDALKVQMMNVMFAFSPDMAAHTSGLTPQSTPIFAIGMGSLGSHVFINLMHLGYGRWTLVDPDVMLPHNFGRHALVGQWTGTYKACGLAALTATLFNDRSIASSIATDVLMPTDEDDMQRRLKTAAVILDMSASVAVSRHLVYNIMSPARRLSLFLSPSGQDLVLLAEDAARTIPLDCLEMQYYRLLLNDPRLHNHLHHNDRFRYAQSCRHVSAVIAGDLVAQHAATGSRALRAALTSDEAMIAIWHDNPADLSLSAIRSVPQTVNIEQHDGWTLCVDQGVLTTLAAMRAARLPVETGGILVGTHDTQRRILYVVDALPSPLDSQEWPTSYIRGSSGLPQRLEEIETITAGQVAYVGEWHSHPNGQSGTPSTADRHAFAWLTTHMGMVDLPGLMAIVGTGNACQWFVGSIP